MTPKEQHHIKTLVSIFEKHIQPLTAAERAACAAKAKKMPPYIMPPCPTPRQWRKVWRAYHQLTSAVYELYPRNSNGVIIVPPTRNPR